MSAEGSAEALVLTGPRHFERRRFALPDVSDDDGLLRIEACGLCGTDHEQYTGHIPAPHAFIPGHEVVGIVEEVGDRAAARWGVRAGERVAVEVFQSCRECDACRHGTYRRCERNGLPTMVGFVDADRPPSLWGGYATHLYLGPDSMLLPVPPGLDPVLATMFNPLGAGIRWAVDLPETQPGDVVAILGPGVRGLCAAAAAKQAARGVRHGHRTRPTRRRAARAATAFGADLTVDVEIDDPSRALKRATGGLADVVVDVTAKAPAAFAQAIALARPGGTVVDRRHEGLARSARLRPRPHRVQGAPGARRARGRRDRVPSRRSRCSRRGRFPFAELSRQVAGFDEVEPLIQLMAGEREGTPPIHAVFAPTGSAM